MEKKTRLRDLQQIHRAHNTYCESMGQFRIPFRDCQTKGLLVLLQEARILRQREITYLKEQKTRPGYQDYVKDWEDEDRKYHEEEKMRLEVVIEALKKGSNKSMKTKFLHRWVSICSAHQEHQEDCSMCDAGNWQFIPAMWISSLFFMVSPRLWRWWMNARGLRFTFTSGKTGEKVVEPFRKK